MKVLRTKWHYTCIQLFLLVFSVMFLVIVFLMFKLLTTENCNCHEPDVLPVFKPPEAIRLTSSTERLAVLVPFRERFDELLIFAPYIHKFLLSQNIKHDLFILNQVDAFRFNRASLINVGFIETRDNYTYLAMHDVDLLPLNNNLSYAYPNQPFHVAAPNLHPRYHYEKFIGGILLVNREHFQLVNGLSNKYWGWGLEDDEFYVRLKDANLTVQRPQGIKTGTSDTFRHIHGKERKRDTIKCYNQRESTRRRDRKTGLHDVKYKIKSRTKMVIEDAPLTIINVQLFCDHSFTPWCNCTQSDNKKS